jgi:hypothetical protein
MIMTPLVFLLWILTIGFHNSSHAVLLSKTTKSGGKSGGKKSGGKNLKGKKLRQIKGFLPNPGGSPPSGPSSNQCAVGPQQFFHAPAWDPNTNAYVTLRFAQTAFTVTEDSDSSDDSDTDGNDSDPNNSDHDGNDNNDNDHDGGDNHNHNHDGGNNHNDNDNNDNDHDGVESPFTTGGALDFGSGSPGTAAAESVSEPDREPQFSPSSQGQWSNAGNTKVLVEQ